MTTVAASFNKSNTMTTTKHYPMTATQKADEAFLRSLTPEIIAQQERIMNQIQAAQKNSSREDLQQQRRLATTNSVNLAERQQLSIRDAVFC